jgi:stage II sporulation protein AA (anti-sigma F factor antagonist)
MARSGVAKAEVMSIQTDRRLTAVGPGQRFSDPRRPGRTTVVAEISGEIDLANAATVFDALTSDLCAKRRHLVVDARSVTFLDSTGIEMLLRVLDVVRGLGGSLHIVATQSAVCRVIALLGLSGRLSCLPSLEAALACADRECLPTPQGDGSVVASTQDIGARQ